MRRAAILLAGLALGGCAPDIHGAASERARNAVDAFLSSCARQDWPAAADLLEAGARRTFIAAADKSAGCAEQLGLAGPTPAPEDFEAAGVEAVSVHGDSAKVRVRLGGRAGVTDLHDQGLRFLIGTR